MQKRNRPAEKAQRCSLCCCDSRICVHFPAPPEGRSCPGQALPSFPGLTRSPCPLLGLPEHHRGGAGAQQVPMFCGAPAPHKVRPSLCRNRALHLFDRFHTADDIQAFQGTVPHQSSEGHHRRMFAGHLQVSTPRVHPAYASMCARGIQSCSQSATRRIQSEEASRPLPYTSLPPNTALFAEGSF